MKRISPLIIIHIILFPQLLWAQYHFDFESGLLPDEGVNPNWSMEQIPDGRWGCDSLNALQGVHSLHHLFDNPEAGCDYFVIHHEPVDVNDSFSISFRVRHGFPPSSANNWQVAILAEIAGSTDGVTDGITDGIVVGVNFKGSDDLVKIWRTHGGVVEELSTSSVNYQEMVGTEMAPLFRLTWTRDGGVFLFHSIDPLSEPLLLSASCRPGSLPEGRMLVIRHEYSSARDRHFWIDEIKMDGHFVVDTIPPEITSCSVEGGNSLRIGFSERIVLPEPGSFRTGPVVVPGAPREIEQMVPESVTGRDSTLQLFFPDPFTNRAPMALYVKEVADLEGNLMTDAVIRFMRNEAVWGDVVFNEVMYDPEPPVADLHEEYVELFNRSDYPLDLEGWKLTSGSREMHLNQATGVHLEPGAYGVVGDITLPNRGTTLALYTGEGTLVHAVTYRSPWPAPSWKLEGGWSIEATDPELVCNISAQWEFSVDRSGGTPGRVNSLDGELADYEVPVLLYYGFGDSATINLNYSEPVRFLDESAGQLMIQPGSVQPEYVAHGRPTGDELVVQFSSAALSLPAFNLRVPGVTDCQGNLSRDREIRAGACSPPVSGSILINEIMYDPAEGSPEYIELYNPGSLFIDLKELALDVVGEGESPERLTVLSNHSRVMGPGEYVVLTRDVMHLMDGYNLEVSGRWAGVDDLKSLPNSGGWIYLLDRSGSSVDLAIYDDRMHMEQIDLSRGISLERISPERSGAVWNNWHSAASIAGYATPGRANSQSLPDHGQGGVLSPEPRVISPDNDGFNDLLGITITTMEQGSVIRLWITDLEGNLVRELANNHIVGPEARYVWDGRTGNGSMAMEGIYVLHLKGTHPASGLGWNKKAAVGVVYR
ncbi:MAG: lamin tail domain-containing protein [Bacteroidota bacterium]